MAIENKYGDVDIKGIPEDEPIFIFRAQDVFAALILRLYQTMRRSAGDHHGADDIGLAIRRFESWGTKKIPD